ncbi:response regulator [Aurantiacibacter atlanticus]|uniref:Response regulator n=1 Tax=Aurantiacibacter atlanticus TaxID=1648404 RepID=A0A0H4VF84_9SPHN|nr:response regulator [Aurantiacibacter atlanticus]AKQ41724.1 response regulator [Aurantiacibacter atlanticus]MDF1833823.1 response regulator [Alteraurantiacibacter sp. bin_em_oilr2.035]
MATQLQTEQPVVLVVEDEFIIALDLSETVRDLGYRVEGPFADKDHAMVAIADCMPDLAILDVMTSSGEVFPLADALTQAGVPIIFHSGHYTEQDIAERYPNAAAAAKPCPPDKLISLIENAYSSMH